MYDFRVYRATSNNINNNQLQRTKSSLLQDPDLKLRSTKIASVSCDSEEGILHLYSHQCMLQMVYHWHIGDCMWVVSDPYTIWGCRNCLFNKPGNSPLQHNKFPTGPGRCMLAPSTESVPRKEIKYNLGSSPLVHAHIPILRLYQCSTNKLFKRLGF